MPQRRGAVVHGTRGSGRASTAERPSAAVRASRERASRARSSERASSAGGCADGCDRTRAVAPWRKSYIRLSNPDRGSKPACVDRIRVVKRRCHGDGEA
mmetsp:Transcript_67438/g.150501  ORF Transcript_67438/g.150501 Transcript_67438/m.150501 type:complete len:99 (-) Transcript_67438:54-350(-)|eukprot:CAMPEP_0181243834 /NCGR_PEP_ID=MMETSP1096-20121128/42503_1 /TAXON_ID=156174 ORGANISM="Chrysochromulina ericina, Strain CCMP281" /NCGR_SAMPLE_ID=MMETSP1096 /ASSEMBLY_ACC=CAM_ASM_000453 /LENGTH=98 /DNA_ID=CAMNT_0023340273 /DNA_START=516 /DNA_END=812 /DNA_ORIENTATION=+